MLMQILKYSLALGIMICLSKVAVLADEAACMNRPWACNDHAFLCSKATYISNGKIAWDYTPNGAAFADGARQQGLTCQVGKVAQTHNMSREKSCGGNVLACSGEALCEIATRKVSGKYRWQDKLKPQHVAEAKRRKLTCGVVGKVAQTHNKSRESPNKSRTVITKKITSAEILRDDFKVQTVLIRKQIQYALKQLGYYDSAIDGIWGKRTQAAIMRFSEVNNLSTYPPRRIYFEALELVDVPTSFADRTSRSTQKSSDECVSILSLLGIPVCNKNTNWNSTPMRRSSYVESCTSDIDCEYPQKCIGTAGRRSCGTIVDQYGNRSTDPLSKPMTCISSSDCPASFRCDSTLLVCVR